jgi:hypothetical protein
VPGGADLTHAHFLAGVQVTGDKGEAVSDPVAAAMMKILKARGLEESLTHFRFEGEFCMSCDWRRIDLSLSSQVPLPLYATDQPTSASHPVLQGCRLGIHQVNAQAQSSTPCPHLQ